MPNVNTMCQISNGGGALDQSKRESYVSEILLYLGRLFAEIQAPEYFT